MGGTRGALLVARNDTEAASYPAEPTGWSPLPMARLPFPSIIVTSTDDEYVTVARATELSKAWGSRLVNIGAAGHINSASGLGSWPTGKALLTVLMDSAASTREHDSRARMR